MDLIELGKRSQSVVLAPLEVLKLIIGGAISNIWHSVLRDQQNK